MTDDELDRAGHDAVRRLLADARHTDPMPVDVAARMDAALAGLAQEASADEPAPSRVPGDLPPITPLATHRRRKAATLLLAAAAIVVGGVVVQQLHAPHGPSAASSADGGTASSRVPPSEFASGSDSRAAAPTTPSTHPGPLHLVHGRPVIRPRHFSADALSATRAKDQAQRNEAVDTCVPSDLGGHHGRLLPVSYHHAPAVLLLHRPQGATQVVDLFLCGHASPTRSVTLALP